MAAVVTEVLKLCSLTTKVRCNVNSFINIYIREAQQLFRAAKMVNPWSKTEELEVRLPIRPAMRSEATYEKKIFVETGAKLFLVTDCSTFHLKVVVVALTCKYYRLSL